MRLHRGGGAAKWLRIAPDGNGWGSSIGTHQQNGHGDWMETDRCLIEGGDLPIPKLDVAGSTPVARSLRTRWERGSVCPEVGRFRSGHRTLSSGGGTDLAYYRTKLSDGT